tara:strand:+ start:649 stop:2190 length:1542 start_codon:yes stop_codon:yes gene_type:complete
MSDWSSFKGEKAIFDAWRDYIYESNAQDYEVEIDEGFMSGLKKAAGTVGKGAKALGRGAAAVGKEVGKKTGLVQDPSQGYRRDHGAAARAQAAKGDQPAGDQPAGDQPAGDQPAGDQPAGAQLPKETPLSIIKRQPNVKIGPEGQKEPALAMQLQKMGLSQQISQLLAKRLGQYLQQRQLKVAEAVEIIDAVLLAENLFTEALKQKGLNPKTLSVDQKALIDTSARQADIQPGDWKKVSKIKGLRKGSTLIAVDKDGVSRAFATNKSGMTAAEQHAAQGIGPEEAPEEAPEAPAEEEPAAEEPSIVDALRTKLKQRDLDSDAGMKAAAKGDEQAYLGAYMYYKSLVKLQKALAKNPDAPADKLIGLIKEEEPKGESRAEVLKWLAGMIAKFKQAGLTDGKRAVAAARAARGAEDTQSARGRDELIAAFGAEQTAVGKIIANFISDNEALLGQDPALKKLFTRDAEGNAPAFDQFAQVVKQALAQQLQRRGYKPEEFGNILESVLRETLLESRK